MVPRIFVAVATALATILHVLLFRGRRLGRENLSVRSKGVDKTLLLSPRGKHLKAFVDGSVSEDGASCGIGVYYEDGHPYNFQGGFACAHGGRAQSNLAELAALFWALWKHPRGQHLTIFSDSMHALQVVQAASADVDRLSAAAQLQATEMETVRVRLEAAEAQGRGWQEARTKLARQTCTLAQASDLHIGCRHA